MAAKPISINAKIVGGEGCNLSVIFLMDIKRTFTERMMAQRKPKTDTDDLLVFGYSCKLFRDDEKAKIIDEGQHLIPWMGQDNLKIDRYDARGTLFDLSRVEAPPGGYDRFIELTENERAVEVACDEERYRSLNSNEEEDRLYREEEEKRLEECKAYGQVGYTYEEKKEEVKEEVEEDEPFVPSPMLDIPVNMALPTTKKHNAIIEKTAMFLSSQGPQMEIILKAKQSSNPMFDFLTFGNSLHPYYRLILSYIKAGRYVTNSESVKEPSPEPEYLHPSLTRSAQQKDDVKVVESAQKEDSNSVYSELLTQLKMKAQMLKKEQEEKELKKREEEQVRKKEMEKLERLKREEAKLLHQVKIPPRDIALTIAKMASYAARNGRGFETIIKKKKDARYQFLESSHEYHEFYVKKIEAYQSLSREEKVEPEKKSTPKVTPISFAIKAKETPSIKEKSALPEEDSEDDEFDLLEGDTKAQATDKKTQMERKRKVSAFLKSLNVKECDEELQPDTTVIEVKKSIETKLKVPAAQMKLLYKGKPLSDQKTLADYNIQNDATLHVVKNKVSDQVAGGAGERSTTDILRPEIVRVMKRFYTEAEANKIADEYMKDFNARMEQCSLDDFERLAMYHLQNAG